jgi:GT2 family glycosyltransferase
MLVRRELLQDLQGFGEVFQHCGEDLDLCFRARAAGWKIYYDANATIVHLISRSSEQDQSRCRIDSILGNEEYFVRCYGRLHGRLYRLMNRCVCLPRVLVAGIVKSLVGAQSRAAWLERLEFARFLCRWKKPT